MSSPSKHTYTSTSHLQDRHCWAEVSDIPAGINAEEVGSSLRLPPGETATVTEVTWTCPRRTKALLRISGLDSKGEIKLMAMNPNALLVDRPHERLPSANPVSSLIPTARQETKGAHDPRGQPSSVAIVPQRAPRAAFLHPAKQMFHAQFKGEDVEPTSNMEAYSLPVMDTVTVQPQYRRPGRAYSESSKLITDEFPGLSTERSLSTSGVYIPGLQPSFSSPPELGIQSRTVKFEGVDETWDRDHFEMALDNEEMGGGAIEEDGIVLKGSTVYITFKEPEVAQRMVAKGNWDLLERNVKTTLVVKSPDPLEELLQIYSPTSTVVLQGIPEKTTRQSLLTHIAANTHLEEGKDYMFEERNGTALVGLKAHCNLETFINQINQPKHHLNDSTQIPLQATRLHAVDSILLTKIEDKWCDRRKLRLYFSNKGKSGGGNARDVEIKGRGQAVVSFSEIQNLRDVLQHNHSKLGPEVAVCLYHPILSEWNTPNKGETSKPVEHQPFHHPISDALNKHFSKYNVIPVISARLCDCCADFQLLPNQPAIAVQPLQGSEWMPDWYQCCEHMLTNSLEEYSEVAIDVPPDVAQEVFQVVMLAIQNTEVTVDQTVGRNQQILIGKKDDVAALKSELDRIIHEKHYTTEEIKLSTAQLVYIDRCLRRALSSLHPEVTFSVDLQKGTLQGCGAASNVEEFICRARRAEYATQEVTKLPILALRLLASFDGRGILQKHISDYRIGYFFVSENGSIPESDLVPVVAIHLVGETRLELSNAADRLSAAVVVDSMNTNEEFKTVVRLQAWDDMRQKLQQNYLVHIHPEPELGKLRLASLKDHMEDIKADLLQFLIRHCYKVEAIPLYKGQAEYLQKHCTEWTHLQQEMNAHNVRCLLGPKGQNVEIRLNGKTTPVKLMVAKVRKCIHAIAFCEMHVTAPMAVKHLQSEAGAYQLTGIAGSSQASIQVVVLPQGSSEVGGGICNAPSPFDSLEPPLHQEICVGTVTEGGMTVSIMHGDLTEYHVDVMVNAANENLHHAGGVARELVRKGGDIIQSASSMYVAELGQVRKGKAVLMKAVGSLPCRAIVHAVGPRWNGGMDNEQWWIRKTVHTSLQEARNYATVAFPAMGTGVFRVPAHVSAQGMLDGIVAFAKENPSSIEKVTIMLYQEEHIDPFVARAVTCLCDVMIKDHRFKKYAARRVAAAGSEEDVVPKPSRHLSVVSRSAALFRAIRVKKGSLREQKADVYINPANSALDLTNSGLDSAGRQLRDACNAHIRQHGVIPSWGVATTDAGNLKCKHVIHAVIGDCRQSLDDTKQCMADMLARALQECNRLRAKAVAIPAIGMGDRVRRYELAAKIIIEAVAMYLRDNPSTSIQEVILVQHSDEIHTAYQAVYTQMQQEAAYLTQTGEASIKRLHSHFLNDVSLEILSGDIEQVECDGRVLVSTVEEVERDKTIIESLLSSDTSLQNRSLGSMHAPLMEEYSLVPQEVRVVRLPREEMLKCRLVLQVLSPLCLEDSEQTVLNILQKAEEQRLESVAFPASMLRSTGHSLNQVVSAVYGIISAFIREKEQHLVKNISVVIPERKHRTKQKSTPALDESTTADILCIGVFSGSKHDTDRVISEIRKLIDEKFHCEQVKDDRIDRLPVKSTDWLQQQASAAHVNIVVKRAPQNVIVIEGERVAVSPMTTIVQDELKRVEQEELFISKVQWKWRDFGGVFQNYPHSINWDIEKAYQRKDDIVLLSSEEGTQLVDFEKMMQHSLEPPFTVTEVRRQDVQREGDIPPTWDPMRTDEKCRAVPLAPDSDEYKEVADMLSHTLQPGVNVPGMTIPYNTIVRINRIQNKALYLQYLGSKQAMQTYNFPRVLNELRLWHGCKDTVVKQINHGGFNRSFAAVRGNAYGHGVYFARDASCAAQDRYSPRDEHRHKHIYLARVLVGEYTLGNRALIVPPPKDPNNPAVLYDSVVDNMDPSIFCIFYDAQAYPEYHIEFC